MRSLNIRTREWRADGPAHQRQLALASSGSGTITAIDATSGAVIGVIAGGNGTFDVKLSPDGSVKVQTDQDALSESSSAGGVVRLLSSLATG